MYLVGLCLLATSAILSWDFIINYGLRAEWRIHPYGRLLLFFMCSVTGVLTISTINGFFRDYPGRNVIRLVAFSGFVAALLMQVLFLRCHLKREDQAKDEPEQHSQVDSPVQ